MNIKHTLFLAACAGLFGACASNPTAELVDAREAYRHASTGPTATVAPAEVHIAAEALARAERSYRDDADSYRTRDLSYIALRKSQLAVARGSILTERDEQERAEKEFQAAQGKIVEGAKETAAEAEARAAEAQAGKAAAEAQAAKAAAEAQAALAKLAAVKQEPRGVVITLSGSVLFASNQSILLPEAQMKLNEVADVLLTTKERNIVIEGHTDAQGSDSHNMVLSQDRADAVRNYLIQRGYEADRITARGLGESVPVADNGNPEGRANNRRVEIIIQPETSVTNNQ